MMRSWPADEDIPVLRRRAAALARRPDRGRTADASAALLFELAGERYCIAASCVLRVLTLRELTPLPGAAAPLFGVTHWRGTVLTLLDIRALLGVTAPGLTDMGRVVVVEGPDRDFGVIVDAVRDILELRDGDILKLPDRDDAASDSLLRGITADGVFVVDARRLVQRYGRLQGRKQGTG
jgi:purine-binding chemotaxis protein CheW